MDITEVKTLIDNLQFIEKELTRGISAWKNKIRTCDDVSTYGSKGLLKRVCEQPTSIHNEIFAPLYSFLNTYLANREGRVAFTSIELDNYLLRGVKIIRNYIVISDFFARNSEYLAPYISPSQNFKASKESLTKQKLYKDFIFTINERLIGCKDKLNFMFLKLLSTVKNMTPEIREMQSYLDNQCTLMRIERLRM